MGLLALGCDPEPSAPIATANAAVPAPVTPTPTVAATRAAPPPTPAPEPEAAPPPSPQHLVPPPPRDLIDGVPYVTTPAVPSPRVAQAFQFDSLVYRAPSAERRSLGVVRRNTQLAVDHKVDGDGCKRGWYALSGGGFVCNGVGFQVAFNPEPLAEGLHVEPPTIARALPYRYAKLDTPARLYWRLPTVDELTANSDEPVRGYAKGARFVATTGNFDVGGETFARTVRGHYVRARDLQDKPPPTMEGQLLSGRDALPLAFVHVDEASLRDIDSDQIVGSAEKFARFAVERLHPGDDPTRVRARDGFAVAAADVRVARLHPRPDEVGSDDQWIHVDLDQQTLVAYEGDRPVLATLVSSGKAGFEPPRGLFHIHKKYTTVTMSGPDPDAGTYSVAQVPWTMYYWGSFALHGAYWHDTFGNVRSHGCTNLPPVDARWLFYWSEPAVPAGWHAKVGLHGPWVYFSRGGRPTAPSVP